MYIERFNTCVKASDEMFVEFASKLRTLLDYYLESRDVDKFEDLYDLLICDRIKSALSEGCLKYILSVESGKTGRNWLPVSELTSAVDKFVAARADQLSLESSRWGRHSEAYGSQPVQVVTVSLHLGGRSVSQLQRRFPGLLAVASQVFKRWAVPHSTLH